MIIDGENIRMTRGDTEPLIVSCETDSGELRPFVNGDIVTLTVAWPYGNSVLVKRVDSFTEEGCAVFTLEPEDTGTLQPYTYRYDIQLTAEDVGVKTIIGPSDFVVEGDITRE